MKVRLIKNPDTTGYSSKFNTASIGEVIVGFDEGDMDSVFISDLEVYISYITKKGYSYVKEYDWIPLRHAFSLRYVITDNYHTEFFEPANEDDRRRGYTL